MAANLIKKNDFYRIVNDDKIADFKLYLPDEYADKDINITSKDMSNDNIIFMNNLFATPDEESPIIGEAYVYENHKCINHFLVGTTIISDNFIEAKQLIENYFS